MSCVTYCVPVLSGRPLIKRLCPNPKLKTFTCFQGIQIGCSENQWWTSSFTVCIDLLECLVLVSSASGNLFLRGGGLDQGRHDVLLSSEAKVLIHRLNRLHCSFNCAKWWVASMVEKTRLMAESSSDTTFHTSLQQKMQQRRRILNETSAVSSKWTERNM